MDEVAEVAAGWNDAPATMAEEPASFEEFFHLERDRLFRVMCVITDHRQEAEDISQDALQDARGRLERRLLRAARLRCRTGNLGRPTAGDSPTPDAPASTVDNGQAFGRGLTRRSPARWSATDWRARGMDRIIESRGVRKTYRSGRDVEALKSVDIDVTRGELVAIVGPSGSGKTTLLNCLSGLERIDQGTILVDGKDLSKLSDNERTEHRARSMGFVFQAFNLLPVLTAVENVEIPMLLLESPAKEARTRALETLELVGLADRAQHRPDQLSGGEQQRVAVARALVHRPAVVWADEPTGNLDSESTASVMDLFLELNRAGQTIVMVTHNREVAESAHRIVSMRDGRIEGGALPNSEADTAQPARAVDDPVA
jgi:putative ABC transport system ATP-binding protein